MLRYALTLLLSACLAASGALAVAAESGAHGSRQHGIAAQKNRKPTVERPYGREGDPRKVERTIRIDMSDAMRYFPDQVRIKRGATIRFALRNNGELPHEMVIGTMDELKQHAQLLRAHGDMAHDEPNVAHVAPGATGRMVWQFTRAGEFYYGCLVPGHFDAGMIGTIVVR
jgi:uncharacterized cupredoxin-like copper-binding protein